MEQLGHLCQLLDNGGPLLLQRHRAQLHTLLGLYAMTMNLMELAETQLNAALRVSIIIVPSLPSFPLYVLSFGRPLKSENCGRLPI